MKISTQLPGHPGVDIYYDLNLFTIQVGDHEAQKLDEFMTGLISKIEELERRIRDIEMDHDTL